MAKEISNISDYVKRLVDSGVYSPVEVEKFTRIYARQGRIGEEVQTILKDGTVETGVRSVAADSKTGQPGWIVRNVSSNEEWIVEDSVFQKKYEPDPENNGQFKPKGGPMLSIQIHEDISFAPPMWGGDTQVIKAGGYLLIDPKNPIDIYGIGEAEFLETYAPTQRQQLSRLNDWAIEGNRVRLSYDVGELHVSKADFDRAFGAIVSVSYEDVKRDFAIPDEKLWSCNAWVVEGDMVRLSYAIGDLHVKKEDFDSAFGAIVNAPYYDVEKDFAVGGIDDILANATQRSEATVSGLAKEDRGLDLA